MKETPEDSSAMSTADFMSTFLDRHAPPIESMLHFRSIPWLNPIITSPLYKPIPTFSRHLKSSGEDYYFSKTINTPSTIPHFVTLQLKDFITPPETQAEQQQQSTSAASSSSHRTPTIVPENPDALILLALGPTGLDGHPATLHGGVTCAILDETMGLLVMLHDNNIRGSGERDNLYTGNLNVSYRAPVSTPGEVLVRTWLTRRQGRKWYSKGQIVDKDGKVLAEGDGLWVTAKRSKI